MNADLWWAYLLIGAGILLLLSVKKQGKLNLPSFGSGRKGITPNLDRLVRDLTEDATAGKIDPVIGRESEILRVTQILSRRTKNNPLLVGLPGVRKTAIIEGLALKIATGDVPPILAGKRVLSLQIAELMAGTKYRGEFEQRAKQILDELKGSGRSIILFIDEIHTIIQSKGTEGSIDFADILKPALARGDIQLIGATTKGEYEKYIQPEESLERRFQIVIVNEPSVDEAIRILHGLKKNYETFHHVTFTDGAIEAAVKLSEEYIKGRRLPDKAIDLLDEAAAMVMVQEGGAPDHAMALIHGAAANVVVAEQHIPPHVKALKDELLALKQQEKKTEGVKQLQTIRRDIIKLVKKIEGEEIDVRQEQGWPSIDEHHIKNVVADWIGVEVSQVH